MMRLHGGGLAGGFVVGQGVNLAFHIIGEHVFSDQLRHLFAAIHSAAGDRFADVSWWYSKIGSINSPTMCSGGGAGCGRLKSREWVQPFADVPAVVAALRR